MSGKLKKFKGALLSEPDVLLPSFLALPHRGSLEERFAVYRNAFDVSSRETMEEIFPVFSKFVGEERWQVLGQRYISEVGSRHYDLSMMGSGFSIFLEERGVETHWVEMAALEAKLWETFHAPNPKTAKLMDQLSQLGEDSVIIFPKNLHFFEFENRVGTAYQEEKEPEPGKETVLVFRAGSASKLRRLEAEEAGLLKSLLAGEAFGAALDRLEISSKDLSQILMEWAQIEN